jgi:hypothetical protein
MCRKRRRRAFLLALALLCFGFGIWLWFHDDGLVTKARFDRIKKGMTLAEVEATLGSPHSEMPGAEGVVVRFWTKEFGVGGGRTVGIRFDSLGHVEGTGYVETPTSEIVRGWWIQAFGKAPPF